MNEIFNIHRAFLVTDYVTSKKENLSLDEVKEMIKDGDVRDVYVAESSGLFTDLESLVDSTGIEVSVNGEFLFLNV